LRVVLKLIDAAFPHGANATIRSQNQPRGRLIDDSVEIVIETVEVFRDRFLLSTWDITPFL